MFLYYSLFSIFVLKFILSYMKINTLDVFFHSQPWTPSGLAQWKVFSYGPSLCEYMCLEHLISLVSSVPSGSYTLFSSSTGFPEPFPFRSESSKVSVWVCVCVCVCLHVVIVLIKSRKGKRIPETLKLKVVPSHNHTCWALNLCVLQISGILKIS